MPACPPTCARLEPAPGLRRGLVLPLVLALGASCQRGARDDAPTRPPRATVVTTSTDDPDPREGTDVPPGEPPAEVAAWLGEVSASRLRATVDRLAAFGTRHTLSPDASGQGIGAARRWLREELGRAGGRLQVSFDPHPHAPDRRRIDTPVDVVNVVALLPGTMPEAAQRRVYVIGHYDSRASDPMDRTSDAPGANDDGSGTALVVELARVLAQAELDATVVFMATAGEEQGLLGARAHAVSAKQAGVEIVAVLSNDIVGDPSGPGGARLDHEVRVFSEGLPSWIDDEGLKATRRLASTSDSTSRQVARFIDTVARWHSLPVRPRLVFRHDRFLRGGDHTAFNELGYPGVRFTEMAEDYTRQHQDLRTEGEVVYGDRPEHVDASYLAGVARLNLAALVHLANAPAAPTATLVVDGLTTDTTLRWSAAAQPDVAGYEVVWRRTTSPTWTHVQDVGNETRTTLPLHKDDWFFGVRAYDREGYRSPVAFATL